MDSSSVSYSDISSPVEYLQDRQREFPSPELDASCSPLRLREIASRFPYLAEAAETWCHRDYALQLLSWIESRLPDVIAELIESDMVALGEVNDPSPNAFCKPLGPRGFAVMINTGFKTFTYRVIRAFSTRLVTPDQDQVETIAFDDTCKFIGDIYYWFRETRVAYGPDYPITESQLAVASRLTYEANSFFLAHELGHGVLHLVSLERSKRGEPLMTDREEEFAADRIAVDILLSKPERPPHEPSLQESYAAIELALLIWLGLERFGIKFEPTHPSAEERLSAIRSQVSDMCVDDESRQAIEAFAAPMRSVFGEVVSRISKDNYEAFLNRTARHFVADLAEIAP